MTASNVPLTSSLTSFLFAAQILFAQAIEVPKKYTLSPEEIAAVKDVVGEKMSDPDSAKFRKIVAGKFKDGVVQVCGEVNGKNKFGGYVGYIRFTATFSKGDPAEFAGWYNDEIIANILEEKCLPVRVVNSN